MTTTNKKAQPWAGPDVAFPRLNALAFWPFLLGSAIALSSFITPQGSAAFGWTANAPLPN
ncbi:hypothetical protein [Arthrobacter sp. HLT1-20]